jgi:acetoacetyl-CoA synthetase
MRFPMDGVTHATDLHYQPDPRTVSRAQWQGFSIRSCERRTQFRTARYTSFEAFVMAQFRTFWALFLDWSNIICEGNRELVCAGDDCKTAVFFPALRLNYAENLLRDDGTDNALIGCHAYGSCDVLTRGGLRDQMVRLTVFLRQLGVEPGDIAAAIARNNIEMTNAALGSAAIGAVFFSCSHDMDTFTV